MYFKKYEKQLKNYFDTRKEEEDNIDNNITNASKEIHQVYSIVTNLLTNLCKTN